MVSLDMSSKLPKLIAGHLCHGACFKEKVVVTCLIHHVRIPSAPDQFTSLASIV